MRLNSFSVGVVAGGVLGVVLVAGVARAVITPPPASWETVPYQGFLEQNGVPVTGARDLCLQIWDDATAGTLRWSEQQHGVNVTAGQFGVRLGSNMALPASLAAQPVLFLRVGVNPGSSATTNAPCDDAAAVAGGYTLLDGRQELGAAPFALSARRGIPGQPFDVDGVLGVGGNAVFQGNVGIGAPASGSLLTVAGTVESTTGGIKYPDGSVQTSARLTCTTVTLESASVGCSSVSTTAYLPPGYVLTGGGCVSPNHDGRKVTASNPVSDATGAGWFCQTQDHTVCAAGTARAYVVGCRIP